MSLVLHIGYHKTGSTALQNWLAKNRKFLEDNRIIYPEGMSSWLGHPELAWCSAVERYPWQDRDYDFESVKEYYASILKKSLEDDIIVLLSSEEFCRLDFSFTAMSRLREYLKGFNPVIMGYYRYPIEFLMSRYRHEVQHGGEGRTIREFLNNVDNILSANFHSRTLVWEDCFKGRCIFRNYSDKEIGRDLPASLLTGLDRSDLLEIMNLDQLDDDEAEEVKLHPALIECMRQLYRSDVGEKPKKEASDLIFKLSQLLPEVPMAAFIQDLGLTEETYRLLGSLKTKTINDRRTLATFRE